MDNVEKKLRIGCLSLIVIIIVSSTIYIKRQTDINKEISKYGKFTIGVTYDKSIATKGNDYIYYYFYFKNKKYTGKSDLKLNVVVPNGRYFVKFSTKNPKRNLIYFDKPVPDTLKQAPNDGWENIK